MNKSVRVVLLGEADKAFKKLNERHVLSLLLSEGKGL